MNQLLHYLPFSLVLLFLLSTTNNIVYTNNLSTDNYEQKNNVFYDNSITINALKNEPVRCDFFYNKNDRFVKQATEIISKDLTFSGQIKTTLIEKKQNTRTPLYLEIKKYKKDTQLNTNKISLYVALFMNNKKELLLRKRYTLSKEHLLAGLHKISDEIIQKVTNQKSPFLYTLTYTKRISHTKKVICVADYAGSQEEIVTNEDGICTAPVWHTKKPILLYSYFTKKNGELRGINLLKKKRSTVLSTNGLSMQPSFSPDGKKAIACSSQSGSSQLYALNLTKKNSPDFLQQLTQNSGNNSSPCLLENNDYIFCSDFETGSPQLYYHESNTNSTRRLTSGKGYCAAPSYSPMTKKIAYVRHTQTGFQIFTLHLEAFLSHPEKEPGFFERQLTSTPGDKHEPSWSPCGRYILCALDFHEETGYKKCRQITALDTLSCEVKILTHGKEDKSFPSWTAQTLYRA